MDLGKTVRPNDVYIMNMVIMGYRSAAYESLLAKPNDYHAKNRTVFVDFKPKAGPAICSPILVS